MKKKPPDEPMYYLTLPQVKNLIHWFRDNSKVPVSKPKIDGLIKVMRSRLTGEEE